MPLRFLLDENLRSRALWAAIQQHNAHSPLTLDTVRVGDPSAPPTGQAARRGAVERTFSFTECTPPTGGL